MKKLILIILSLIIINPLKAEMLNSRARFTSNISAKQLRSGSTVAFSCDQDIYSQGQLIIPQGSIGFAQISSASSKHITLNNGYINDIYGRPHPVQIYYSKSGSTDYVKPLLAWQAVDLP